MDFLHTYRGLFSVTITTVLSVEFIMQRFYPYHEPLICGLNISHGPYSLIQQAHTNTVPFNGFHKMRFIY